METVKQRSRAHWLVMLACALVSLLCLIYPIYVIRPFRAQGVRELAAALVVMRFRAIVIGACVVLAVWSTIRYWGQHSGIWKRIGAVLAAMGVCAIAALSRVNVYELMFHPLGSPAFESAGESKLDKDEKVIAIEINGAARAYPIRGMSYHHIVNDTLGGVPIVATY
jgi:hypothetical protein